MSVQNIFTGSYYEKDPRWSAVDGYTISHLHPPTRPNHAPLVHALEHARDEGLPDIATQPVMGKFLALQCRIGRVKHALEIGTLGAYTSIWLATENPEIKVTSVEVDPKHARVARENIEAAGVGDRVEVVEGSGLDVLPRLAKEIKEGKREKFGFVYIDADKQNNWAYFDMAVGMCEIGGSIYVDNMVFMGAVVAEEHQGDERIKGIRKVIENAGKDKRVNAVIMQTVCEKTYDGVLIAVVVKNE
ncbi:MAG: hypothetical protein M1834_007621 [Cirrosporium novae-zelandiae]|nr:MAG: hypothetical protein M1834_007621 [Cirrosporium novae-zelandiae]